MSDTEPQDGVVVHLTGGPLLAAREAGRRYLLALDTERLLAPVLREAGLPHVGPYPGWESGGLDGHTLGHWLSACASMVAGTGDPELGTRLRAVVAEIARAQEHLGTGYVGGVPRSAGLWQEVAAGITPETFTRDRWVPWYNLHKLATGLLDAHVLMRTPKALDVLVRLAAWWDGLAASIDHERFQLMLATETGGMVDLYVRLHEVTEDPRHLAMARRFVRDALVDPLASGEDPLTGLHANTQIPQVVGVARLGRRTGEDRYLHAASAFWASVAGRRSVSIGGNSVREHFHDEGDFRPMVEDREGPETCNSVNMIRLARELYETTREPGLLDAVERIELNHVLSAQHPGDGGLVYFTSMRPDHYRVRSTPQHSFWCCVGTGLESHARHADLLYGVEPEVIEVRGFAPSVLRVARLGLELEQETGFPADGRVLVRLRLGAPTRFTLRLRVPGWSDGGARARVDGRPAAPPSDGWITIDRSWEDGDVVRLELPMSGRLEVLPDGSRWASVMWGPLVLAARGEPVGRDEALASSPSAPHSAVGALHPLTVTPVLAPDAVPVPRAGGYSIASDRGDVALEPFHALHDARYTVYFPLAEADDVAARRAELADRDAHGLTLDGRSIDRVVLGEQQPEVDHGFAGVELERGALAGRPWRTTARVMRVRLADPLRLGRTLSLTWVDEAGASFGVRVDGRLVGRVGPDGPPTESGEHPDERRVELPLAPTDAPWGRRVVEVVAVAGPTPRMRELRVLSAPGDWA